MVANLGSSVGVKSHSGSFIVLDHACHTSGVMSMFGHKFVEHALFYDLDRGEGMVKCSWSNVGCDS